MKQNETGLPCTVAEVSHLLPHLSSAAPPHRTDVSVCARAPTHTHTRSYTTRFRPGAPQARHAASNPHCSVLIHSATESCCPSCRTQLTWNLGEPPARPGKSGPFLWCHPQDVSHFHCSRSAWPRPGRNRSLDEMEVPDAGRARALRLLRKARHQQGRRGGVMAAVGQQRTRSVSFRTVPSPACSECD